MKSTLPRPFQWIGALAMLTMLALPVRAATPSITATLEPSQIAVGDTAQLTVTMTGTDETEPVLPKVDGLEFTPLGQSSQYQSINGVVTTSRSVTYLVTPTRAGTLTIPALKIGHGRDAAATQPVVFRVTPSGARQAPPSALPTPNMPNASGDQTVSANGQPGFLRLVTPKHELYVGELVPVQIKAYFRDGTQATLDGPPVLSSDAFTLNNLDDKPVRSEETLDGQPYVTLTWTTALSAVKTGTYPLSLEMPVVLKVRSHASKPHNPFGNSFFDDSLFDDSFFDNFFENDVEKPFTLKSDVDPVNVLTLPAANRPPNFSGAVGHFNITAEASPRQITAGDPITLRLTVTGSGNFDRVSSGLLSGVAGWKSYKPVARFAPADSVGYEGTKTFEQAIVPQQSGQVEIPALSFSFFDPDTRQYMTRSAVPITVEVAPAAGGRALVTAAVNLSDAAPAAQQSDTLDQPPFAPNRIEPGHFTSTLRPLFLQPWFLIVNFLAWVGLAAMFSSLHRRAALARSPRASQADLAIREQIAAMETALQHAESAAFFASARRALQLRLSQRWGLPPETITLAEINARLNGEADGIRPVFQIADQLAYCGGSLSATDLSGWKQIVTDQLKKLEPR